MTVASSPPVRCRRNWTETEVVAALTAFVEAVGDKVSNRSELSQFRKLGLSWSELVDTCPILANRSPTETRRKVKVILTELQALSHDYDGQRYYLSRWPSLPKTTRNGLIGEQQQQPQPQQEEEQEEPSAVSFPSTSTSTTSAVSSPSLDTSGSSEAVTNSQDTISAQEEEENETSNTTITTTNSSRNSNSSSCQLKDISPESAKSARSALEETWDAEGASDEDDGDCVDAAVADAVCVENDDDTFDMTELQSATSQLLPTSSSQVLEASQVSTVPPLVSRLWKSVTMMPSDIEEEDDDDDDSGEDDHMVPLFTARGDHRDTIGLKEKEEEDSMLSDVQWFDACEVVLNEDEEKELAMGKSDERLGLRVGTWNVWFSKRSGMESHNRQEEVRNFVCGVHEDGWPDILMVQESNLSAHRAQVCYFQTHLRRYEYLTGYKSQVHDTGVLVNSEKFSVARPVPEQLLVTIQERLIRAHYGAIPQGQLAAALGRICLIELEHEKLRSRFFACSFHATRHQANACSSVVLLFLQELSNATRMPVLVGGDFNCDIVDLLDGNPDLDCALTGLTVAEYSYKRHRFKGNRDKLIDRLAVMNPICNREFDLKLRSVAACCFEETLFLDTNEPGARTFDHLPIMGQLILGEKWATI